MPPGVRRALERAQRLGFLGDPPLETQIAHALGFARVAEVHGAGSDGFLDLGSGGGLPGLVLAAKWQACPALLLEANQRRADALRAAVDELGWGDRVQVLPIRAEQAGRDQRFRASMSLVVARSFGPPAVVAECGAPLLRPGGLLVVSEPPPGPNSRGPGERWPPGPLRELGLEPGDVHENGFRYRVLRLANLCPERYPRRTGIPVKRPLFGRE